MKIPLATVAAILVAISVLGSGLPASADATISVSLTDYAVSPSSSTATPGVVTFNVSNDAPIIHDFHVIQTDLAPDALPVDQNTAQVDLTQVNDVANTPIIQPGGSDSSSIDLPIGSYVLICNLPGHYGAGMYAAFTVAQAPAATLTNTPFDTDNGGTTTPAPSETPVAGGTGGTGGTIGGPTTGYGPDESGSASVWLIVAPLAGFALFFGAAGLGLAARRR